MGILVIFHVQYWPLLLFSGLLSYRMLHENERKKQQPKHSMHSQNVLDWTKLHLNWTYWILPSNNMQWTYQWSWINESKETRTNQTHTYTNSVAALHATFPSHELGQDKRIALMINNKRTTIRANNQRKTTKIEIKCDKMKFSNTLS